MLIIDKWFNTSFLKIIKTLINIVSLTREICGIVKIGVFPVSVLLEITDLIKNSNTIFYRKQKLLQENMMLDKNRGFL